MTPYVPKTDENGRPRDLQDPQGRGRRGLENSLTPSYEDSESEALDTKARSPRRKQKMTKMINIKLLLKRPCE